VVTCLEGMLVDANAEVIKAEVSVSCSKRGVRARARQILAPWRDVKGKS